MHLILSIKHTDLTYVDYDVHLIPVFKFIAHSNPLKSLMCAWNGGRKET